MRAPLVTTAVAVWLLLAALAGTAEAQTKNCVRNCLTPYTTAAKSVQREVKPKCRAACKNTRTLRKTCKKEVAVEYRNLTKTCADSLKEIKRGQPPLTISVPIGTNRGGDITNQIATYWFEEVRSVCSMRVCDRRGKSGRRIHH